jgi:predicted AAA+ superfamily ATPase
LHISEKSSTFAAEIIWNGAVTGRSNPLEWCIYVTEKQYTTMRRKIYDYLLEWKKQSQGKVALMIDGARRIGKSYIAEEFARNEYRSYILVDFSHMTKNLQEVFDRYLNDTEQFFMYLQSVTRTTLYARESVIIFDEVQFYPAARAAIKHLVKDGKYDYIETGSLISINKNVRDILIPSEERRVEMYPMDFEEFLWALGDETTMPFIRHSYEQRKEMGPAHRQTMDLFRQYMLVGGMPQAVQCFVDTKNFMEVDQIKRDIIKLYKSDIQKYATGYESKVSKIFEELPGQLQKHEKRFKLAALRDRAKYRDYDSSFFWLGDSQIVSPCFKATEPTVGLRMRMDSSALKLYMSDTGLLISHAFDENTILSEELYAKLLLGKLEVNKGMLVENIVAQMLRAAGHKLYFYSSYSKTESEERMEIDFLIAKPVLTNRHNICPIEVKSTKKYTITSLEKFQKKFAEQTATPIVLHSGDLKEEKGILYLPIYMTPLL